MLTQLHQHGPGTSEGSKGHRPGRSNPALHLPVILLVNVQSTQDVGRQPNFGHDWTSIKLPSIGTSLTKLGNIWFNFDGG